MNFKKDKILRNSDVAWRHVDGLAVLITPHNSELHRLNEMGTFIWNRIPTEGILFNQVVDQILIKFEVERKKAEDHLKKFFQVLFKKRVVVIED